MKARPAALKDLRDLCRLLRAVRVKQGLTQRAVSNLIGLAANSHLLSVWEHGHANPNSVMLVAWGRALGQRLVLRFDVTIPRARPKPKIPIAERRLAAGCCEKCGKPRDGQSKRLCQACLELTTAARRKRKNAEPWTPGKRGRPPFKTAVRHQRAS